MEIFTENTIHLFFCVRQIDFIWILTENGFGNINFATNKNTLNRKMETQHVNTFKLDHRGPTWIHAFLSYHILLSAFQFLL